MQLLKQEIAGEVYAIARGMGAGESFLDPERRLRCLVAMVYRHALEIVKSTTDPILSAALIREQMNVIQVIGSQKGEQNALESRQKDEERFPD